MTEKGFRRKEVERIEERGRGREKGKDHKERMAKGLRAKKAERTEKGGKRTA